MKRCCFQTIFQRTVKETGRSLLLDAELDLRLRSVIVSLRTAGIKIHVVKGVLMGLVQDTPVHTMINTLQITLQQSYLFQLIYTGKTTTSRPNVDFPDGFFLSQNEKHWPKAIKQRPFASLMTFRI